MERRMGLQIQNKPETEILAQQIRAIEIDTYLVGYKQCAVSDGCLHPKTILDAKFSTPYSVSAAFLYGTVGMEQFESEVVFDPAVQNLLEKVTVHPQTALRSSIQNTGAVM